MKNIRTSGDIIIDAEHLHIRHIEPGIDLPFNCKKCGEEIEPIFNDAMVSIVIAGIMRNEMPTMPSQKNKVRIIIQNEGKMVW